jgi:hypothetical protein
MQGHGSSAGVEVWEIAERQFGQIVMLSIIATAIKTPTTTGATTIAHLNLATNQLSHSAGLIEASRTWTRRVTPVTLRRRTSALGRITLIESQSVATIRGSVRDPRDLVKCSRSYRVVAAIVTALTLVPLAIGLIEGFRVARSAFGYVIWVTRSAFGYVIWVKGARRTNSIARLPRIRG